MVENAKKPWILRSIVDLALAGHLVAAAGYGWLSPKGFPLDNSRFWLNSAVPIVLIAVAFVGLIGMHKSRWLIAGAVVLFFASAWCTGAIAGRIIFPISLRLIWVMAAAISVAGLACFFGLVRGEPRTYRIWLLSAAAAMFFGGFAIWAQIPPSASTRPINAQPPQLTQQGVSQPPQSLVKISPNHEFDTAEAEFSLTADSIRIQ